jgi:hypothetical protein
MTAAPWRRDVTAANADSAPDPGRAWMPHVPIVCLWLSRMVHLHRRTVLAELVAAPPGGWSWRYRSP